MRLTLLRHAHPEWLDNGALEDAGLSPEGIRQAEAAARLLASRLPKEVAIWSGPARRARETAAPVAAALGSGVVIEPRLDGLDTAALRQKLSSRDLSADVLDSLALRQEDVWAFVEALLADSPPDNAVFVSHEAVIGVLVCRSLGMELSDLHRFRIDPASVSVIDFRPQRTILVSLNETHHLPAGRRD